MREIEINTGDPTHVQIAISSPRDRKMDWGWCDGHDAPLIAGPDGLLCHWQGHELSTQPIGTEPLPCDPEWKRATVIHTGASLTECPTWGDR